MSAEIVKFPEPRIRPDLARCHAALALCEGDPALLLFLALNGVQLVYNRVPVTGEGDPAQVKVNRLAISFLALAELFGATDLAEGML